MRPSTYRAWLPKASAALATLLAAAPALAADAVGHESSPPTSWDLPAPAGTFGPNVDLLYYFILYMTCAICVAVFAVMIYFIIRYRFQPGRQAHFIHGNNRLETVWTLIPTIILALTAAFSESTWSEIKMPPEPPGPAAIQAGDALHIEVVGKQFNWFFHYPGKDGKLAKRATPDLNAQDPEAIVGLDRSAPDAADDFVTNSLLVIPVGKPVYIDLASVDVIHSFFAPNFRVKQDAVPGLVSRVWLQATKTSAEVVGRNADGSPKPFDIECTELCGQGHFKMRANLLVVSQAEYQKFLDDHAPGGGGY